MHVLSSIERFHRLSSLGIQVCRFEPALLHLPNSTVSAADGNVSRRDGELWCFSTTLPPFDFSSRWHWIPSLRDEMLLQRRCWMAARTLLLTVSPWGSSGYMCERITGVRWDWPVANKIRAFSSTGERFTVLKRRFCQNPSRFAHSDRL